MGTRADFYVGRGATAEWIGSVAMDGYPEGIEEAVLAARDEAAFRHATAAFLSSIHHATVPADGWPWPWKDSRTTDFAYAFFGGRVWASNFGGPWFMPDDPGPEDGEIRGRAPTFPQMDSTHYAPAGTRRSGNIVIGG